MASAPCRTRIVSPDRDPRDLAPVPITLPSPAVRFSRGQIARDLEELCAMGLIEKFRDEYNVTRYRPTNRRRP
jgi:hypothetical protein